jgi:hypothetical protein
MGGGEEGRGSGEHEEREAREARRKLRNLLDGDFLLYELTGDRQMRVLRLPRRVSPPAGAGGRACPRAAGGAPPAA